MRPRFDDDDWSEDGPAAGRHDDWFDELYSEGLITDVVMPLKSGKEASVHVCRANPSTGHDLLAAKVYHHRGSRAFRNDAMYKHGRVILNGHDRRAVAKKTAFGQQFEEAVWMGREWEHLGIAHAAGADVPRPVATRSRTILMEYVGDGEGPAPQLKDLHPGPDEARRIFQRLRWNVEVLLRSNLVHGDLSPYNVLIRDEGLTIIDLPQAVDARTNRNARDLLLRDLRNVGRYFERHGVPNDPAAIVDDLWTRYIFAKL